MCYFVYSKKQINQEDIYSVDYDLLNSYVKEKFIPKVPAEYEIVACYSRRDDRHTQTADGHSRGAVRE